MPCCGPKTHSGGLSREMKLLECTVKLVTWVLTLSVLVLALGHVIYLFEAFAAKEAVQSLIQAGADLYPKEKMLWLLLYSFGEADRIEDLKV